MTDYSTLLREATSRGYSLDLALTVLREQGASPIDSIKAVREVTGVSLTEAKKLVSGSKTWEDIRDSHARFVDEIADAFESDP